MGWGRTLLERLSRGRSFVRRLPDAFGALPVVVTPDSQLKYLKPGSDAFDASLLRAAAKLIKPGDNVWDIGANVGVFSAAAAALSRTGRVVAVEPDLWLAGLLRRTSSLVATSGHNISVVPVAAYSHAGIAEFQIAKRGRASSHLASVSGGSQTGGVRETVVVPVLPLDLLLKTFPPPQVIKIDVEGAELDVLLGLNHVLTAFRPRIYCEVTASSYEAVNELLSSKNYDAFDLDTGRAATGTEPNIFFAHREAVSSP